MGKEIERKFLLAAGASIPIPETHMKMTIKQGYIHVEKDKQIRVRLSRWGGQDFASVCIKYTGKLVRDEFDFPVQSKLKDAKELYKKCKYTLEKKRLTFSKGHEHYDIDTFPNGMTFVEVEFMTLGKMKKWKKPSWLGKEITNESKYSNIVLAKKNLKF